MVISSQILFHNCPNIPYFLYTLFFLSFDFTQQKLDFPVIEILKIDVSTLLFLCFCDFLEKKPKSSCTSNFYSSILLFSFLVLCKFPFFSYLPSLCQTNGLEDPSHGLHILFSDVGVVTLLILCPSPC